MTLLVISPDYASHLLPLATLATAWRDAGDRVVVASGPATASITAEFGFDRVDLRLGRGSNPGVIRAENQVAGEDDALRGFFAATERGMVETLLYQANARSADLLWDPVDTANRVLAVVDAVQPDQIIVDHLAFSARLALLAGGVPHADVVLGHPSALPVGDEVYGYPPAWPAAFDPDPGGARRPAAALPRGPGRLHRRMEHRADSACAAGGAAVDAFTEHADLVLLNYPAQLHDPARTELLPPHAFLGSAVRRQDAAGRHRPLAGRRPGQAGGLRQLRQFPVGAGRCAGQGGGRAARRCRCGWRWRSVPPTGPSSAISRRSGWCGNSCRRSRWWSGRHW